MVNYGTVVFRVRGYNLQFLHATQYLPHFGDTCINTVHVYV